MDATELEAQFPRHLKLRELRVLLAVAEHGSFHGAARALHVTQPAVTATIAHLEEIVHAKLFDRTPQGALPTAHGVSFIHHARAIFGELRLAAKNLSAITAGARGDLRVGTVSLPASGVLPVALAALLEHSPDVSASILEAQEPVLIESLKTRDIDIFLSRKPREAIDPALHFDLLYEDGICLIVSRSHACASRRRVNLDELWTQRWVLPPRGTRFRDHIDILLERCRLPPPPRAVETLSVSMMHGMVGSGGYVGFSTWSERAFSPMRPLIAQLKVDLPVVTASVGVVSLKDRQMHPLASLLVANIRRLIKENPDYRAR